MSDATAPPETLLTARPGERVAYAVGALLTAEDFTAEQDYHRGRLGRALAYLHGAGTIAGLDVVANPDQGDTAEIRVTPGIAVDRLGRILELDRESCLRIARWLDQRPETELRDALRADHVVLDVFANFHACPGALQPVFATATMDTLDAALPSRLRDRMALTPHLRLAAEDLNARLPRAEVPPLGADAAALHAYKRTELWRLLQPVADRTPGEPLLPLGAEHVPGRHEGTELLLARVTVPVAEDAAAGRPRLDPGRSLTVDNEVRRYSYGAAELALLHGIER
jgi:hypothetical protein